MISIRTVLGGTQLQSNSRPIRVRETMDSIKVKNEFLPTRCETCHKADCFDPLTNTCTRCSNIEDEDVVSKPIKRKLTLDYSDIGLIFGVVTGIICGIIVGVLRQQLQIHTSANVSNFWIIVGLALLGAVWGAAIGETIKKVRNRKNLQKR